MPPPDDSERPQASEEEDASGSEPSPCPACRGTGSVISKLGGTPSKVPCPWCEGTGTVIPGHDAQASRREGAGPASGPSEAGPPEPPSEAA